MNKTAYTVLRRMLPLAGMLLCYVAVGQNVTVQGRVVDQTGEAIPGANVLVKGTTNGTLTDADGNYSLTVPNRNSTLVFSFLGYQTQELSADGRSMTVTMHEDSQLLDDVVVIGYGQVKKRDATGSVLSVKAEELNKGSIVSAQDALMGKVAGVNVTPSSGAPGSGATIRVRAGSSLSASNDPLIVIDGVPVDNSSINGSSNIIGSINPADIESFTVLKDASSTAIYGSRASNGVIIITTKKGKIGSRKPAVSYTNNFTISQVTRMLDVLDAADYKAAFAKYANAPADFALGNDDVDYQKEIYHNAFGQEHNVSVSGAVGNMPYRASVGYTNQDGIIKTNNYQRTSASVGLSPRFLQDHLTFDINVKGSYEDNKPVTSSVVGAAIAADPTRPIHATYPGGIGCGYYTWMNGDAPMAIAPDNALALLELDNRENKVTRSIGNMAIDYKIHGFEDLRFNLNLGYDVLKSTYDRSVPQFAPQMYTSNQKDGTGLEYTSKQNKRNTLLDFYTNYTHTFAYEQHLDIMVGYGWQRFWKKFNDENLDPKGVELSSPTHSESEYYLLSWYGRLNYSFADRYLLTATFRADASSRFRKENRWGYFPSVALAWKLKNEAFLRDVEVIDDLKIRLSYGQTGQQDIGSDYPALSTYTASYDESRYRFGNTWYTTYRPDGYDPNIKWETTSTYNIGFDWAVLDSRLGGSVDYYFRETKDLLNNIAVPAGANFTNVIYTNIGSMENKGLEIAFNAVPVKTRDFEWRMGINFTWNDSKITKLNTIDTEDNYVKTGNAGGTGKYLQVQMVDETPYTFFLLRQAYNEDGSPKDGIYLTESGEETTSEEDAFKYVTGHSSQAPCFAGLNMKFLYKDWDLGFNGHGSFGNYVFNYVKASESLDDLYSSQGTSSNIQHETLETAFTQQRLYTDYFLEDASFFRLDNITLGYSFRHLWNKTSSLRLSLAVQNVFTITGYSGMDPEIYNGIDKNVYQRPRVYMFGMSLNF